MEGDNYAGGWGKRTADVYSLGDVARFQHVDSVYPIFIEIDTQPVRPSEIDKAIQQRKEEDECTRKAHDVERLEAQLAAAKAQL